MKVHRKGKDPQTEMVKERFVMAATSEKNVEEQAEVLHQVQREVAKVWLQNDKPTYWSLDPKFTSLRFELSHQTCNAPRTDASETSTQGL